MNRRTLHQAFRLRNGCVRHLAACLGPFRWSFAVEAAGLTRGDPAWWLPILVFQAPILAIPTCLLESETSTAAKRFDFFIRHSNKNQGLGGFGRSDLAML